MPLGKAAVGGLCAVIIGCSAAEYAPLNITATRKVITGQTQGVVFVAHRGNGFGSPENSLEGFGRCVKYGVTSIETDVRYSSDKVPILLHDRTLDRTTNLAGEASRYSARELRRARLANNEPLPTLEDALKAYGAQAMFYLDMKEDDLEPTVRVVAEQGMFHSTYFLLKTKEQFSQVASLKLRYPEIIIMPCIERDRHLPIVDSFGFSYKIAKVGTKLSAESRMELRQRGVVLSANMLLPWHWDESDEYANQGMTVLQTDRPQRYLKPKGSAQIIVSR